MKNKTRYRPRMSARRKRIVVLEEINSTHQLSDELKSEIIKEIDKYNDKSGIE